MNGAADRAQAATEFRQREIVEFVRDFARREGSGPTQAQIATACGVGVQTVGKHLRILERQGAIEREAVMQRGRFRRRAAVVRRRG